MLGFLLVAPWLPVEALLFRYNVVAMYTYMFRLKLWKHGFQHTVFHGYIFPLPSGAEGISSLAN